MKEEDYMLKKIGTENAFHVPEGYFENLTSEIMNRLPEKRNLLPRRKRLQCGKEQSLGYIWRPCL